MADVAEIVEEVPQVEEKEKTEKVEKIEKKVVDIEAEEKSNDEAAEPKANGNGVKNGDAKESNGVSEDTPTGKRKSGAGDAADGVEGTPEKKAKVATVVTEESEESNSTNGSAEVAA